MKKTTFLGVLSLVLIISSHNSPLSSATADGDGNNICAICYDTETPFMLDIRTQYRTECGHGFHADCLNALVNQHHDSACPICRNRTTTIITLGELNQARNLIDQEMVNSHSRELIKVFFTTEILNDFDKGDQIQFIKNLSECKKIPQYSSFFEAARLQPLERIPRSRRLAAERLFNGQDTALLSELAGKLKARADRSKMAEQPSTPLRTMPATPVARPIVHASAPQPPTPRIAPQVAPAFAPLERAPQTPTGYVNRAALSTLIQDTNQLAQTMTPGNRFRGFNVNLSDITSLPTVREIAGIHQHSLETIPARVIELADTIISYSAFLNYVAARRGNNEYGSIHPTHLRNINQALAEAKAEFARITSELM